MQHVAEAQRIEQDRSHRSVWRAMHQDHVTMSTEIQQAVTHAPQIWELTLTSHVAFTRRLLGF